MGGRRHSLLTWKESTHHHRGGWILSKRRVSALYLPQLIPPSVSPHLCLPFLLFGQPGFFPLGIPVPLHMADLAGWGGACNPHCKKTSAAATSVRGRGPGRSSRRGGASGHHPDPIAGGFRPCRPLGCQGTRRACLPVWRMQGKACGRSVS